MFGGKRIAQIENVKREESDKEKAKKIWEFEKRGKRKKNNEQDWAFEKRRKKNKGKRIRKGETKMRIKIEKKRKLISKWEFEGRWK